MIPKQAIEKAIEGGWKPELPYDVYHIVADPTFWQALGKALGWKDFRINNVPKDVWHIQALRFYNLILTGGDTEAFWKELLTNQK